MDHASEELLDVLGWKGEVIDEEIADEDSDAELVAEKSQSTWEWDGERFDEAALSETRSSLEEETDEMAEW